MIGCCLSFYVCLSVQICWWNVRHGRGWARGGREREIRGLGSDVSVSVSVAAGVGREWGTKRRWLVGVS